MRRDTIILSVSALALLGAAQAQAQDTGRTTYEPARFVDAYFTKTDVSETTKAAPTAQPAPRPIAGQPPRRTSQSYAAAPVPSLAAPVAKPAAPAPRPAALAAKPSVPAAPRMAQRAPSIRPSAQALGRGTAPPRSGSVLGKARAEVRAGWDAVRIGEGEEQITADGALYGASAGYDHVLARLGGGGMFVGGFASVDFASNAETSELSITDATGSGSLFETETGQGRDVEIGLRTGWMTDRFTAYALAALSNASRTVQVTTTEIQAVVDASDPTNPGVTNTPIGEPEEGPKIRLYDDGWRVGAGGEFNITQGFYVKGEYRFTTYDQDDTRHQVVTGVGLRF